MKKTFKSVFLGVFFGILCLIAATAIGLGFIHVTDFPYKADIEYLEICDYSGYDHDTVLRNYHDAMRFLSPFRNEPYHLTDLNYSEGGAQHFDEVKVIFNWLYALGLVCTLSVAAIAWAKRRKSKQFLLASSITTLALPLVIAAVAAIDFDAMFIVFHKIFFNNDLWIFDYRRDEIIKILPSEFFMHCAFVIVAFWIIAAAVQFVFYIRDKKTIIKKPEFDNE